MSHKLLPVLALLAFISAPIVIGSAEEGAAKDAKDSKNAAASEKTAEKPKKKAPGECLAMKEREKELDAQAASVKEEMAKLEGKRADLQGIHQKELAEREEQVNKLIETFEGMSPKAAAQVIGGVDDELATMALSKLTSSKAGKILANLKPEKSARLSEMMAYGKTQNSRKESAHGESNDRAPASK